MLVGLLKQSNSLGLRAYLLSYMTFLILLGLLIGRGGPISWLANGTLQRLINVATFVPVGVVGFFFWRELHRGSPDWPHSIEQENPKS
jgi:glycopeptide antibiotics resistance protein